MDKLTEWLKAERGRLSRLAEFLSVTPGAIAQWNEVPAERMGKVSSFTGIPMDELRSDIFDAAKQPSAAEGHAA